MRRLPIYFLLDISDSMIGQPHTLLQQGLDRIVQELRSNPYALETVHLSIIAFAGQARTLVPLIAVLDYYNPSLPIGSGTAMGLALQELMNAIDKDIKLNTASKKGDWKPLVYILTDGKPTDDYAPVFKRWNDYYRDRASVIAIGLGAYADTQVLNEIAQNTFTYNGQNEKDFEGLVRWISNSIATVSIASGNVDLSKALSLDKIDDILQPMTAMQCDQDSVVLMLRCSKTKKLFLAKYERQCAIHGLSKKDIGIDLGLDTSKHFDFSGSYIIDESYFEWSNMDDNKNLDLCVDSSCLIGGCLCPHCGSQYIGLCKCDALFCVSPDNDSVTCPWCMSSGLSMGDSDDDSPAPNVLRSRG